MKKFLISFIMLTTAGCGYTTRSLANLPYKSVYVDYFPNKMDIISEEVSSTTQRFRTYYPRIETDIRKALIDRFMYDGGLRIASKDDADIILKGEFIDYRREPLRYENNQEDVAEYRVGVVTHLILIERKENKVLWDEPSFAGEAAYFTSGTQAKTEQTAINDAITDLTKRVIERLVENW